MLEQSALLLQPWVPAAGGGRGRAILDAAARTPLGLARTPAGRRAGSWFARPVVEIYETEDESLLCTVGRGWWPAGRWLVREADGHLVGSVRGPHVEDRRGRDVAVLRPGPDGGGPFLDTAGVELGRLEEGTDGLRLKFAVWLEGDPFARMLLLAAAVTKDW
jgi:hypothetical protein